MSANRNEKGQLLPGHKNAAGHGPRKWPKPYSDAAKEYLSMRHGDSKPAAWPEDRKDWTFAQYLVERQASQAAAGDIESLKWLVDRAEGKTPAAPEDREARERGDAAAAALLGGVSALQALATLLNIKDIGMIQTIHDKALTGCSE